MHYIMVRLKKQQECASQTSPRRAGLALPGSATNGLRLDGVEPDASHRSETLCEGKPLPTLRAGLALATRCWLGLTGNAMNGLSFCGVRGEAGPDDVTKVAAVSDLLLTLAIASTCRM